VSEQLSVNVLGGFAVHRGDQQVALPPACQRLVALLALKRRPVHRLWVCAMLWPHAQTRRAIASLRSAMWRLRPAGVEELLVIDPQYIALAPHVSVDWHDAVDLIERLLDEEKPAGADPQLVADLLPLLRTGELLEGWSERWVANERDRYRNMRVAALDALGFCPEKQVGHHAKGAIRSIHNRRPVGSRNNDREP
jgi:DNA-binding SARP family transcriptional activator